MTLYNQSNINKFTDFILTATTEEGELAFLSTTTEENWSKLFFQLYMRGVSAVIPLDNPEYIKIPFQDNLITQLRSSFGFLYFYFLELDNFNILECVHGIPEAAFKDVGDTLKNIDIPDNIMFIFPKAFSYCFELLEISPSENMKFIFDSAFNGCINLKNIDTGKSTQEIFPEAFIDCVKLERVILHDKINSLSPYIFKGCGDVTVIYEGTERQWNQIEKYRHWDEGCNSVKVVFKR